MGWQDRPRDTGGLHFPVAIVFQIHKVKLYSPVTATVDHPYQKYAIYFISALNAKKWLLCFSYNEGTKELYVTYTGIKEVETYF